MSTPHPPTEEYANPISKRANYYKNHQDHLRERAKAYYKANREKRLAQANSYYSQHKDAIREKYYAKKSFTGPTLPVKNPSSFKLD